MPQARKIDPVTQLETITPDRARELLGKNIDNRNLRDKTSQFYANQMERGEWKLNSAAITISDTGRILDGQHRLRAIVMANKPIQSFVCTGISDDTFGTIDVGLRRSPADILTIHSGGAVRWPTAIAAALKIIKLFDDNGEFNKSGANEKHLTHDDLIRLYDESPDIQENMEVISQYKNVLTVIPHSIATSLYTIMKSIDPVECEKFWIAFDSGANLSAKHPVLALKNRFANYMANNGGRKVHRRLAIAMIVKAWNLKRSRKYLEKLHVNETDPIIIK